MIETDRNSLLLHEPWIEKYQEHLYNFLPLTAIALLLIYRSTGVINYAHAVPRGRRGGPAPTVRHKLHIVCGYGKPRRLLIPLFLTSVKSHAAALLLACKRARDAPPCYQLFTGKRARDAPPCCRFLRYQAVSGTAMSQISLFRITKYKVIFCLKFRSKQAVTAQTK